MRFCITSIFFVTQCVIGILDWFIFASGAAIDEEQYDDGKTQCLFSCTGCNKNSEDLFKGIFRNTTYTTTTSTRSTPTPFLAPNLATAQTYAVKLKHTLFDNLDFWSGESLKAVKSRRANDEYRKKDVYSRKLANERSGRRRNQLYGVRNDDVKSTMFGDLDNPTTFGSTKSVGSHETLTAESTTRRQIKNTKLNGYTLQQDMTKLMRLLNANASVSVIAKTVEVHDIVLCKISARQQARYFRAQDDKYVDEKPEKKIILIVHGLSPMGFRKIPCLYKKESFMKLLKMYTKHLDKFDIFLIPMGNPDGIADETLTLWNKNKEPRAACAGVNVDRNFDVQWNKSHGYSGCEQQYPGPAPFSEPESRAVADLVHHHSHKIVAYIHVHAGTYDTSSFKGDAVLYPKGYKDVTTDDKYTDINAGIEEAMRNAGFKVYDFTVTSLYNWYGPVTGTSVDYVTSIYGIPYGLEFVMQPYDELVQADTTSEEMQDNVLTEVWRRVIDVTFEYIYKSVVHPQSDET